MNGLWALVGFWERQHATVYKLFGHDGGAGKAIALKFVQANIPVIKKLWPQFNENQMLDDLLGTLEAVLAPQEPPTT
jgi:hypothetical protein